MRQPSGCTRRRARLHTHLMRVTVFGLGYVGLVTGACLAEMGNRVLCVDIDRDLVAALQAGRIPIFEPGLENLVAHNKAVGRLDFTSDHAAAVAHGEVLLIAVGTPSQADGSADPAQIFEVADAIGGCMCAAKIVVVKSTAPVGTAARVREHIQAALSRRNETLHFDVAVNPEFLKEGAAVNDFMRPDRIIIGARSADTRATLVRLYRPFSRNRDKFVHMDTSSAELAKYAANAMLAARISLMNELANLAERLGADIDAVRLGIGRDPRIGPDFLYAGAGFGGACFPKDLKALIHTAEQVGVDARVLRAVEAVNQAQRQILPAKLRAHYDGALTGKTIALWGLAFKPSTDDMREAPSRAVIDAVLTDGGRIRAYDPAAGQAARNLYGERIEICANRDAAVDDADGLVVITEWNEFRSPDFGDLYRRLREPAIFDGRNLYDPERLAALGFAYYPIGRPIGGFRGSA